MRMTNTTRDTIDFHKKDGRVVDGVRETVSLAALATDDLDVDPNDPRVQGHIFAGAVTVSDRVAEKVTASVAAPPAGKSSR
jgi:hypothetical protein